jgi:hypothetical protein
MSGIRDSKSIKESKEEESSRRKRSKSFSDLLLPQFKEIIPITSYRERGLGVTPRLGLGLGLGLGLMLEFVLE